VFALKESLREQRHQEEGPEEDKGSLEVDKEGGEEDSREEASPVKFVEDAESFENTESFGEDEPKEGTDTIVEEGICSVSLTDLLSYDQATCQLSCLLKWLLFTAVESNPNSHKLTDCYRTCYYGVTND